MSPIIRSAVPALILLPGAMLAACEGDSRPFEESVEVTTLGLTALQVTPPANAQDTIYINTGQSLQVGITGFSADTDTSSVLSASDRSFSSSNPAVLSVNENGVVTGGAVPVDESVPAQIFVKIGDLVSEGLTINASNGTLDAITSIEAVEGNASLEACLPEEYFAEGLFSDDTTRTLFDANFELLEGGEGTVSTEEGVVSVNATGGESITLRALVGDLSFDSQLLVLDTLEAITITPGDPDVNEGATRELTATGTYSSTEEDGASRDEDITANVEWSISSTGADNASVGNDEDDKGQLFGIAEGSATVLATCGTAATTQEQVTVGEAADDDLEELSFNIPGDDDVFDINESDADFQLRVSRGSEYDAANAETGDVRYSAVNLGNLQAIDLNTIQTGVVRGLNQGASAEVTARLFVSGDEVATGTITVRVSGP